MTQEQKAKAYDEALEKIRTLYEQAKKEDCPIWSTYEYIFPQLRESEDERIRMALCDIVRDMPYMETELRAHGLTVEKTIAYLEKQEDASYAIEAVDRIDKYIDEHVANAHDMKDSNPDKKYYRGWDDALGKMAGILQDVYSGEKQKEQEQITSVYGFNVGDKVRLKDGDGRVHIIKKFEKIEGVHGPDFYHVEFEDNSARDGIYPGEEYPNGYYTQMEKFEKEQKPEEWGEDDEVCWNLIWDILDGSFTASKEGYKKAAAWFLKNCPKGGTKSIRPQPKPEWSKEDEDKLYQIIEILLADKEVARQENPQHYDVLCKAYDELISWLKSIRPQPRWKKPSEEQMEALKRAINKLAKTTHVADSVRLSIMYDNLMKQ